VNRALRAATMGVLLLSPVVLSACSAGQVTQTATQQRDKTGAQAQVGDLSIRAAELAAPRNGGYESGDDADLRVAIVNGGTESDTLVGVDGKGFSSAEISSTGGSSSSSSSAGSSSAASTTSAAPTSGSTTSAAPTSGSSSSSASTSGSSASTSTSSSGASEDIEIPAGQSVFIGGDQYTITLTGLDANLNTGQYLEVTLTFEKAGSVTIPVTVANPTSSETRGDAFDFHQTEGGSASGSAGG
jgi:sorbitol-specific phosphotransferase system component IIA